MTDGGSGAWLGAKVLSQGTSDHTPKGATHRPSGSPKFSGRDARVNVESTLAACGPSSQAHRQMPDAYHSGQRASVHAMYDPITWPDEGYPCQLCWAVGRWPWEPMRSCPWDVDPESTYCEKHGGKAKEARATWVDAGKVVECQTSTVKILRR